MRPWAEQRAAILHWLVVCGACRRLTLGRALTPCAPIVRFNYNEVVKYSSYSNVRQYLAPNSSLVTLPGTRPTDFPDFRTPVFPALALSEAREHHVLPTRRA